MSVSFLTSENPYTWYGASLNLSGVDQSGNLTSPIVTSSNVLCANLYVARAQTADNFSGNISANATIEGWLDTTGNVTVGSDLVIGGNLTVGGVINGSISNSLTSNVALVAYSVSGGNVSGQVANSAVSTVALSALAVDGANVSGQVAIAAEAYSVSAGNVVGQVANAAVSDVALVAYSVDAGNVVGQVANAAVSDIALVAYSVDAANVSGKVSDSFGADWADTANVAVALGTTGTPVNVSSSAPPTTGQVLTATGATTATWQTLPGSGAITYFQNKVTLDASDFTTWTYTNPSIVIPAQGANTVIIVESVLFVYNYGTTPYTGGSPVDLQFATGTTPLKQCYQLPNFQNILLSASARDAYYIDYSGSNDTSGGGSSDTTDISYITNTPIGIASGIVFASGDGTIDLYCTYAVIKL